MLTDAPPPIEQLLRLDPVALSDMAGDRARLEAFRDDCQLLLQRPFAPPLRSDQKIASPSHDGLSVVRNDIRKAVTISSHNARSSLKPARNGTWGRRSGYAAYWPFMSMKET